MKKIYVLMLLFAFAGVKAQQITFEKVIREYSLYSAVLAPDNGYVCVGEGDNSDSKGFIVKIDSAGNALWRKGIGMNAESGFYSISDTKDAGFILCGFTGTGSNMDMFIVKVDFKGDTMWSRTFGGKGNDIAFSCKQTLDNGFIVAGYVSDSVNKRTNISVLKLNSNGNLSWSKIYGGAGNAVCNEIKQLPDGSYALIGYISSAGSSNDRDVCFLKLSSSGNLVWTKVYNGLSIYDSGLDFEITKTGFACYITHQAASSLMKIDFSGNLIWSKKVIDGASSYISIPSKMCMAKDSGFVLVQDEGHGAKGEFVKTDALGNVQWQGKNQLLNKDVLQAKDSGFLLVGSGPLTPVTKNDYYPYFEGGIIKTNSLGNVPKGICSPPVMPGSSSTDTLTVRNAPFSLLTGGSFTVIHPLVSVKNVFVSTGCIPILGSVEENDFESSVSISPNPCSSNFKIEFKDEETVDCEISMSDVIGRKCMALHNKEKSVEIKTDNLSPGIYILRFTTSGGIQAAKKIIKE